MVIFNIIMILLMANLKEKNNIFWKIFDIIGQYKYELKYE